LQLQLPPHWHSVLEHHLLRQKLVFGFISAHPAFIMAGDTAIAITVTAIATAGGCASGGMAIGAMSEAAIATAIIDRSVKLT
jgi:hypothetical protein